MILMVDYYTIINIQNWALKIIIKNLNINSTLQCMDKIFPLKKPRKKINSLIFLLTYL